MGPPVRTALDRHRLVVDGRSWRRLLWAGARAVKLAMELVLREANGDFPKLQLPEGVGNTEDEEKRRKKSTKLADLWADFIAQRGISENRRRDGGQVPRYEIPDATPGKVKAVAAGWPALPNLRQHAVRYPSVSC